MPHLHDPFRVEERLATKIQEAEYLLPLVLAAMLWTAGFVDLLAYRNAPGPILGLYSWKFGLGLAAYSAGFVALYRVIVPDDSLYLFKHGLAWVQARPAIGVPLVAAIVAGSLSVLFWDRWQEMPLLSGALLALGTVALAVVLWQRPFDRPREPWRRALLAVFGLLLGAEVALQAAAVAGALPAANTSGVTVPFGRIYQPGPRTLLAATNRYGWHAARFRLAPQGRRIAVTGDAVVQALDSPVRAHFATLLEAALAAGSPGPRPEVLPLGHPGFGPGLYADPILFPFSAGPFYPSEVVLLFQLADDLQVDQAPGGPRPFYRPAGDGRVVLDPGDFGKRHTLQHIVIEGYGAIHPSRTLKSQSVLLHALDTWWRAHRGEGPDVPPMPRHMDAATAAEPFGPAGFAFEMRGGERAETALRVATGLIRHFQDELRARGVGLRVVTVPAFPRAFFTAAPPRGPWEPRFGDHDLLLPERRFAAMAEQANLAFLPFGEWLRATGRTAMDVRALFNDGGVAPLTPAGHAAMAAAIAGCFYGTAPGDCPAPLTGAARRPMPPPLAVPLPPGQEVLTRMDFGFTADQDALRARVIAFAREAFTHDVVAADASSEFSRDRWRRLAACGLLGLGVPPAFGGAGADAVTVACGLEALGYACRDLGLAFAASAHMLSTQVVLVDFGSPAQQARYLPAICRGEAIGAYCITEPDTGSDAFALKTTARKVDGGYVLDGQKMLITFGPVCDFALVFANANPALGKWGLSLFLVDRDTPGFEAGPVEHKMGLRTAPIGRLTLTDCFVPEAQRVGREGAGAAIFSASQAWERALIFAWQVGAMEAQLERAIAYARERKAFGQPIGKFQSVANRIVEMKRRLETARLLTYKAAWLKASGKPMTLESSLVHLHVGETFIESSLDAVAVHGGRGYLTDFEVERDLRDAVGGVIYGGTSDIQRTIVARLLGL